MPSPRSLYVFDSTYMLLYGGATPSKPDDRQRLDEFVQRHDSARLAIPTVVLAECIPLVPPTDYEYLDLNFEAARLAQTLMPTPGSGSGAVKRVMRLDALIYATAVAHGATAFFTANTADFLKLAKKVKGRTAPAVEELPPPGQLRLDLKVVLEGQQTDSPPTKH